MSEDCKEEMVEVPRELLQRARDYIGSMPCYKDGQDRFFEALRIVEPIEKILNK